MDEKRVKLEDLSNWVKSKVTEWSRTEGKSISQDAFKESPFKGSIFSGNLIKWAPS